MCFSVCVYVHAVFYNNNDVDNTSFILAQLSQVQINKSY